jgi:hypothetical protein
MTQVQLPPRFQRHPEVAAGIITLDQAAMMIHKRWLTHEGACYLLPPSAWWLLPQPAQEKPQRGGRVERLRFWRRGLRRLLKARRTFV